MNPTHLGNCRTWFCGWTLTAFLSFAGGCFAPIATVHAAEKTAESAAVQPQAEPLAGHSYHGEAFNEGPRQAAYLMPGMGKVSFPVTSNNPQVRPFIEQGVGQLHGFWYFEAERSFRQAAALDSQCAIAYWGMAMANVRNEKRAKDFIAEAFNRKSGATQREQLYIDALDGYYKHDGKKKKERAESSIKALERIVYAAPDDLEAKAFLALQIWNNREHEVPVHSHVAVDALLETVFRAEPMHPAHHYRIHLWDSERSENALASAAVCGQTAPGIAHMWHMGGHIYSNQKRYSDAAWQQEASARVDHAHMMRDGILPDRIHNFAHNNEWLVRDLCHLGRARESLALARNMIELPRHPKLNTATHRGSFHYGRLRFVETCLRFELWRELIAAHHSGLLEIPGNAEEERRALRQIGLAHYLLGETEYGNAILARLQVLHAAEVAAGQAAALAAERKARDDKKKEEEIKKAGEKGRQPFVEKANELAKAIAACEGARGMWQGDYAAALARFRAAGNIEETWLARLQWLAGESEPALKAAREQVTKKTQQVIPLANLVELLWLAGQKDEATKEFTVLREVAGEADLESPPLARLGPFALELGWPTDWRTPKAPGSDVGNRPALASLGPPRWSPSPAPGWQLAGSQGETHSLADYRDKPFIAIFFLGSGCLHCAEQLQAFAPRHEDFRKLGVEFIAISTDDREGLHKSIENYQPNTFSFPLVSDAGLAAFKAYRCFDDFEQKPLHGTFLIDSHGLVRWHDIGFEPFQDVGFLLDETRRLLVIEPERSPLATASSAAK